MELLVSPEFKEQAGSFYKLLDQGDAFQWVNSLPPLVFWILRTLEIVDLLVKTKYLDESFFFRIEGRRLANLGIKIAMLEEGRDTPKFEEEVKQYPNGRDLLRRAVTWAEIEGIRFI